MTGGYMGKLLFVDLSSGKIHEEEPDTGLYRNYIGGYGIGARILYDRMKPGVDPLGPENIIAFLPGPLTGTPAIGGARYQVVAKSPLTGGIGDANSGGYFGPYLKFAGYDGVFFSGVSEKPVYLLVDNGTAELRDASHLWGKGTYETEEALEAEHSGGRVICIGPAGEKMCRIASIMTHRGDAAGRSGLGAVMGSKKLKAVVARGNMKVPLHDEATANRLRKEMQEGIKVFLERFHHAGTGGHADASALSGDSPVKNWGGIGVIDTPDVSGLRVDKVLANLEKRGGCWRCPAACKGSLKAGPEEYPYPAGTHRLEYETTAAFGVNCGVTEIEPINMCNYICNDRGLDTISAGTIIAFAMECYENGIISKEDTGGIELNWGNGKAMVAMLEKMAAREGFGDVLADGVKVAAEKIGRGAEKFAVHSGGQELGMHDPRIVGHNFAGMPSAAMYWLNSTPGKHTQAFGKPAFMAHVRNAMGTCMIMFDQKYADGPYTTQFLNAVTGFNYTDEEVKECGDRIGTIRHVFNLREGLNPLKNFIHPRIIGRPPQEEGPLAGVELDLEAEGYWHLGQLDWDRVTTKPSREKLLKLGMVDIADELWPPAT